MRPIQGRTGRDRIVVSTSRCGRDNPGSNPGHGITTIAKSCVFLRIDFDLLRNKPIKVQKLCPIEEQTHWFGIHMLLAHCL